jgi:hypothetical protein
MNIIDILKHNPMKTWKWVAIIFICLFFLQTCSKCSGNQNAAFAEKGLQEQVDSMQVYNKQLQDSILILQGDLQTCNRANHDLQGENEHLRDALKQSQSKPVIIYKDSK